MHFESNAVPVQTIDEWTRVFLKDLFTIGTFKAIFFFSFTDTPKNDLCTVF